ncbi:HPP family protein [Cohnella thermotolerans]|uniref:CBS domain-containing protein n=1 Tax=Cohnella thermotolerans TaxID=329858 RepID=UPI00040C2C58|nr:CBS domain-containing protein [Cohnella thermotolerans]
MKAHEVMIRQVHKVKESDTVRSVVEKFIAHGISGLPVVNERNEIVGIISRGNVIRQTFKSLL